MYSRKYKCGLLFLTLIALILSGCLGTKQIYIKTENKLEMIVGEQKTITIETDPAGVSLDPTFSESEIVGLDEVKDDGIVIKALKEGTANIIIAAKKPTYKEATARVTVVVKEEDKNSIQSITTDLLPSHLPAGGEGQDYAYTFQLSKLEPSQSFAISAGNLPRGLDLSINESAELEIVGTPVEIGQFYFSLIVTDDLDPECILEQEYILNVRPITTSPAEPAELIFLITPTDSQANHPMLGPPTLALVDQYGDIIEQEDLIIEVAVLDGLMDGTTQVATDSRGSAEFLDLVLLEGEYLLKFSHGQLEATRPVNITLAGEGTMGFPYLIHNLYGLDAIRQDLAAFYELANDVDASPTSEPNSPYWNNAAGWEPISDFAGSLDGQGHSITDLFINRAGSNNVGLFASNYGDLMNLNMLDVQISGNNNVGALVGQNAGQIHDVLIEGGSIEGSTTIGGLSGKNSGSITSSQALTTVFGDGDAGGLVGQNSGRIEQSFAQSSTLALRANAYVGGLVGNNRGTIHRSYARGQVDGSSAGGLVGHNQNSNNGIITESYAATELRGSGAGNLGGLSSLSLGKVENSYYDAELAGFTFGSGLPKTTMEMMQEETYVNWDFDQFWDIDGITNDGYPYFRK